MKKFEYRKIVLLVKNLAISLLVFFLVFIIGAILFAAGIIEFSPSGIVDKIIDILLGIFAAALVITQLDLGSEVEESQFILEQNKVFIENQDLQEVENALEAIRNGELDSLKEAFENKKIDRQAIINYLVYLEGLASEIQLGVVSLEEIDNVFSYRYFLALNNIEIQKLELSKDPSYYLGCIHIYQEWYDFRNRKCKALATNQKEVIPSPETALFYLPDYEKCLKKPITVEKNEDGSSFIAHKSKTKVASATANKDGLIEIKIDTFGKLTKRNVRRALLKEIIKTNPNISQNNFKDKKIQQEFEILSSYNQKLGNAKLKKWEDIVQ